MTKIRRILGIREDYHLKRMTQKNVRPDIRHNLNETYSLRVARTGYGFPLTYLRTFDINPSKQLGAKRLNNIGRMLRIDMDDLCPLYSRLRNDKSRI